MATSITNTAFLVGNGFSQTGQTSLDQLLNAYRATRQPEVDALKKNQDGLGKKQIFYNAVRSKLEALQAQASLFSASDASSKFITRAVTSSDATVATVSATAEAATGVSNLKVQRMATNDQLLSDRMTTATKFSDELTARGLHAGIANGTKAFTINGKDYSVSLDGTETNEAVMNKIATAVNADSSSAITAAVVKDTGTTGRLSFISKSVGADGAVKFTDTDSLLSAFGLGSIKQTTSATPLSVASNTLTGTDTLGLSTGTKNFSINGVSYSFNYNTADTNSTMMSAIADAINSNSSSTITASVVDKGSGTFALNIANNSGGGTLNVADTDGFLSNIGISSQIKSDLRTNSTNTKAGYASNTESNLNSLATVNGITVSRSTNSMSDVLSGVTINLLKPQASTDNAVTLTTTVDADAVANMLQPLLDSFNEAMRYMQSNNKGMAGNDSTVRSLVSSLRGLSSTVLGSETADTKYMSDAGLKIGTDGALTIGDKDKLKTLLQSDPAKVSKLFTGENGLGSKITNMISSFIGSDGVAQNRSTNMGTQIKSLDTRIKGLQGKIDKAVQQQQNDYTKLQQSLYNLQAQATRYASYNSGAMSLY